MVMALVSGDGYGGINGRGGGEGALESAYGGQEKMITL